MKKPNFALVLLSGICHSNNDKQTSDHGTLRSQVECTTTIKRRNLLPPKKVWNLQTTYWNSIHFSCLQTCTLCNTLRYHKWPHQSVLTGIHGFIERWSGSSRPLSAISILPFFQQCMRFNFQHDQIQSMHNCLKLLHCTWNKFQHQIKVVDFMFQLNCDNDSS